MAETLGISSVSVPVFDTILADQFDPFKRMSVTLTSMAAFDLPIGQVLKGAVANGEVKYTAVADATELASAAQIAVALTAVKTTAPGEANAIALVAGKFLQDKLTPATLPLGAHKHGSIIITKATN